MDELEKNMIKWKKEWQEIERQAIEEAKKEPMDFEEFCKIGKSIGEQMDEIDERHHDIQIKMLKKLVDQKKRKEKEKNELPTNEKNKR